MVARSHKFIDWGVEVLVGTDLHVFVKVGYPARLGPHNLRTADVLSI